ncbi:hypothetical protein BDZ45DRAFT_742075 [Acephala macrosclerotiorum]|nr:hypothetical protein BDZ45DRAFT_742075 [Acephala macrosclerotiorum]
MAFNIKSILLLILFVTLSPLGTLALPTSGPVDVVASPKTSSIDARDINTQLVARGGTPDADGQITCIFTGIPNACWLRSSQNPSRGAGFTVFDNACNVLGTGQGTVGEHYSLDSELRWSIEIDWLNNDWARTPVGQYAGSSWGLPVENNICLSYEFTHGAYTSCLIPFNCRDPTAAGNKARDSPVTIDARDPTALISRQINTHPGQEDPNGAISCYGTAQHQCVLQVTQEATTEMVQVVLYSSYCDVLAGVRVNMHDHLSMDSMLKYSIEMDWPLVDLSWAGQPIIRYAYETITFPVGSGCISDNAGIWNGNYQSCLFQFTCTGGPLGIDVTQ